MEPRSGGDCVAGCGDAIIGGDMPKIRLLRQQPGQSLRLAITADLADQREESSEVRRQAACAAEDWHDALTHDVFG
jgi:hypothetical protein